MDRDTIAETIFRRFAAPYGDAITPALTQQLRISANLAAEDIVGMIGNVSTIRRRPRRHNVVNPSDMPQAEVEARNEAIAEAYMSGMTLREVAEEFDMGHNTISMILTQIGVPRRAPGRPSYHPARSRVIAMKRAG